MRLRDAAILAGALLALSITPFCQETAPTPPVAPDPPSAAASAEPAAQPQPPAKVPLVLFIQPFDRDIDTADASGKARRIEEIPESRLMEIQSTIQRVIGHNPRFSEVRLIAEGETPQVAEGQAGWILGGTFLDYKKGNQFARYMIGFGAGKQKVEVQVTVRDARSGAVLYSERVVDRKVGGFFGGSNTKGLEDFAQRIVKLLGGIPEPTKP